MADARSDDPLRRSRPGARPRCTSRCPGLFHGLVGEGTVRPFLQSLGGSSDIHHRRRRRRWRWWWRCVEAVYDNNVVVVVVVVVPRLFRLHGGGEGGSVHDSNVVVVVVPRLFRLHGGGNGRSVQDNNVIVVVVVVIPRLFRLHGGGEGCSAHDNNNVVVVVVVRQHSTRGRGGGLPAQEVLKNWERRGVSGEVRRRIVAQTRNRSIFLLLLLLLSVCPRPQQRRVSDPAPSLLPRPLTSILAFFFLGSKENSSSESLRRKHNGQETAGERSTVNPFDLVSMPCGRGAPEHRCRAVSRTILGKYAK